jgi:hypothetical protein
MTLSARTLPLILLVGVAASACKTTSTPINGTGSFTGCALQSSPASTAADVPIGINSQNGENVMDVAQSFEMTQNLGVSDIGVSLLAIAPVNKTVVGSVALSLESDNNGVPSGTVLGSATISASAVSTAAYENYDFHFLSPVGLVLGTKYWIVLSGTYGASSTSYVEWAGATNNQGTGSSTVLTTILGGGSSVNWINAPVSNPPAQEMVFGVGCT